MCLVRRRSSLHSPCLPAAIIITTSLLFITFSSSNSSNTRHPPSQATVLYCFALLLLYSLSLHDPTILSLSRLRPLALPLPAASVPRVPITRSPFLLVSPTLSNSHSSLRPRHYSSALLARLSFTLSTASLSSPRHTCTRDHELTSKENHPSNP